MPSNKTPEKTAWEGMKQRCYYPRHNSYPRYGGRGIAVCERWRNSFAAFFEDVGLKPSPEHSLDRWPDQDGHYEPGNVRWATETEQQRNSSNNVVLVLDGRRECITAWAEVSGIPAGIIYQRIDQGWPVRRALSEPPRRTSPRVPQLFEYRGETKPLIQWCRELELEWHRTRYRIFKMGMEVTEAFEKPKMNPKGGIRSF